MRSVAAKGRKPRDGRGGGKCELQSHVFLMMGNTVRRLHANESSPERARN